MTAVLLGLDIGGSASRARLRNGAEVVDVQAPGANVATLDPTLVDARLEALLAQLDGAQPEACCAGAAGAEVPSARTHLHRLLERRLPTSKVSVVHDARLVLAAAGLVSGIALIAGTGSVAYGLSADGREEQRGGWGWMIGDEGSGVWIAREGAREVVRRADAHEALGALGASMLAACGVDEPRQMILALHAMHEPMQWAGLATAVFEAADGDKDAMEILRSASAELVLLAQEVERSLGTGGPVVLAGGLLLNQPLLESLVRERMTMECVRLEVPPVEGAVRLAEGLLAQ